MANKSVLVVLLVLCIAAALEARVYNRKSLGSDTLIQLRGKSSGSLSVNSRTIQRDFYYYVPRGARHLSLHYSRYTSSGLIVGNIKCGAKLFWSRGSRLARVRAWARGSGWCRLAWTVWVWF